MPPRSLTAVILVGWLVMTALMVGWDLGPRLAPREPNLFPYKMIDEAGAQADSTGWTVTRDGLEDYVANVDWEYNPRDDLFISNCRLWCKHAAEPPAVGSRPVARNLGADTVIQVARNGRLARLDHHANYRLAWSGHPVDGPVISCLLRGQPHDGTLNTRLRVVPAAPVVQGDIRALLALDGGHYQPAEPAPLSERGVVLSPLHPLRQVRDLRAGQVWRATVLDPLCLPSALEFLDRQQPGLRPPGHVPPDLWHELEARHWPDLETVNYRDEDVPCQVIEARADSGPVRLLRIWAQATDGKVLRQEARLWGETWVFTRRPIDGRLVPVNPATAEPRP